MNLITPHKNQIKIIHNKRRFNHIKCGRRFGKTFFINQLFGKAFINQDKQGNTFRPFKIGIWFPTYKDLDHVWTKTKSDFYDGIKSKDESLHQINTITGGLIHFWSMENPDSGRGLDYDRAILDEFAKAKKNKAAWQATIRPTLTDRKGDAWIFSTPKGKRNYFYQLQVDHNEDEDWAFFKFTSYDNPYLDPVEIDSAKKQLDKITFAQEYLAEDVDANEMPFLYCFDEAKHIQNGFELNESLPLWLSFDFNVLPQTCVLGQRKDEEEINVRKIIKLNNASIYDMCNYINAKYGNYYFIATGDASGKNRSGTTKGNLSYWRIIKDELGLNDSQIKLRSKNLDHTTSQIICNSVLEHKIVKIHPECVDLINDCLYAAVDENGKLIKTPDHGLHFFDGFRYLLDANFPNVVNIK